MQQMAKQWERKPREYLGLEVCGKFSKHLLVITQRVSNTFCSEKKKKALKHPLMSWLSFLHLLLPFCSRHLENPKLFPVTSRFILFILQILHILVIKSPCEIIVLYFSIIGSTPNMFLFSGETLRKARTLRSASVIKYRINR